MPSRYALFSSPGGFFLGRGSEGLHVPSLPFGRLMGAAGFQKCGLGFRSALNLMGFKPAGIRTLPSGQKWRDSKCEASLKSKPSPAWQIQRSLASAVLVALVALWKCEGKSKELERLQALRDQARSLRLAVTGLNQNRRLPLWVSISVKGALPRCPKMTTGRHLRPYKTACATDSGQSRGS